MVSDVITLHLNRSDITDSQSYTVNPPSTHKENEFKGRKGSGGTTEGNGNKRETRGKLVFINNSSLQLIKDSTGVLTRPLVSLHGDKLVPAPDF